MKGKAVVHSNKSDEWGTPQAFFDIFDSVFEFKLDAAASASNKKCRKYYSEKNSALDADWIEKLKKGDAVWINPPYSLTKEFVEKAIEQHDEYKFDIVMLVASRTDTEWFYRALDVAKQVFFIKGRLKFEGAENGAPFPSCIFIFTTLSTYYRTQLRLVTRPESMIFPLDTYLFNLTPQERGFPRRKKP